MDEKNLAGETYTRPWGNYKVEENNENFQMKILTVNPGGILSLQKHLLREEHWVCICGSGEAQVGDETVYICKGSYIFIPKQAMHRLHNTASEPLMIAEIQLGDAFEENDIIRFDDIYGR